MTPDCVFLTSEIWEILPHRVPNRTRPACRLGGAKVKDCPADPELWDFLQMRGLTHQYVQLQSAPGAGQGLYTAQGRKRGQLVLSVPENVLLTVTRASKASSLGARLQSAALPDWSVLAACLAELKARSAGVQFQW